MNIYVSFKKLQLFIWNGHNEQKSTHKLWGSSLTEETRSIEMFVSKYADTAS